MALSDDIKNKLKDLTTPASCKKEKDPAVETVIGKFSVRMYLSLPTDENYDSDPQAWITVACDSTRIALHEFDSRAVAGRTYAVMVALLLDVSSCVKQDPSVFG